MDLMDRRRFLKRIMAQASSVETGSFVVSEDTYTSQYHISHHLGSTPDFVMVVADEIVASASFTETYIANAYCAKANFKASNFTATGFSACLRNRPNEDAWQPVYEAVAYTKFLHDSNFEVPYYSSNECLKAGVTYHYVVGKFE